MNYSLQIVAAGMCCFSANTGLAEIVAGPVNPEFQAAYDQAQAARNACLVGEESQCMSLARPLAEAGNPVAQNLIGTLMTELGTPEYDPAQGTEWLMRSAAQGYDKAWYNLGDFFEEEHAGLAPNDVLAVASFQSAVDLGYALASEDLAWHLLLGGDAVQDHARALRVIYDGKANDPDNGYFDSLLGDSFYFGFGQDADHVAALRHYEVAAISGNAYAQFSAGYQYYLGEGTEIDDIRAVELFEMAAAQDYPNAFGYLAESYSYGYTGTVDFDRAIDYARRGDALGDGLSAAQLGYMTLQGDGTEADPVAARLAFERGVERGNADALYQLGDMAYFGLDQEVNYQQALDIYHQVLAMQSDHAASNYSIAYMMMYGEGTEVDVAGAIPFIQTATTFEYDNGYKLAAVLYGHADFDGPHADPVRAMAFCLRAIELGFLDGLEMDDDAMSTCAVLAESLTSEQLAEAMAVSETL